MVDRAEISKVLSADPWVGHQESLRVSAKLKLFL